MVRSTVICAALSLFLVGALAGCGKPAAPTRPAPAVRRAPPGPLDGGLTPGPNIRPASRKRAHQPTKVPMRPTSSRSWRQRACSPDHAATALNRV